MNFDFTNYTFSGMMSILAALLGLCYPLIIQSIEKIYSQYDSTLLSERFTRERIYIAFQILLAVNFLFAICVPFLLHAAWWNSGIITIQALLLIGLIACLFRLFSLLIKYSNAGKLLKHIEGLKIDKNNVMDILDIAIYADSKNNYQLFVDSMSDVSMYFTAQQGDNYQQDAHDAILPPVRYDKLSTDIILKLRSFVREDDGHHLLYRNSNITSVIFNQISKSRIDVSAHILMWQLLNEAISSNNHSWFKNYWQFADSYASLKYRFAYNEELRKDKRYFMLRHVMIGALLVHFDRKKWFNDIFFYTHSEPEYYGLIPSSFADIIDMMENIDNICQVPQFYDHGFYFADEMSGVKDEKYVFREAVRYLSLLVIRLWSLERRSLHFDQDILTIPLSPRLISDDERESFLMEMMKQDVEDYYSNEVFCAVPRLLKVEMSKPIQLLDDYRQQCLNTKKKHTEHPDVDLKKFEALEEEAIEFANSQFHTLPIEMPVGFNPNDSTTYKFDVHLQEALNTIDHSPYKVIGISGHTVWPNFQYEIGREYFRVLEGFAKLGRYKVPRDQISIFLSEIGYSEDKYKIIVSDKIAEIGNAINMNASISPFYFFIIPAKDLPFVKFNAIERDKLHPIVEGLPISSNYIHFRECHEPNFSLTVATEMNITTNNNVKGVVFVEVDESYLTKGLHAYVVKKLEDLFD